MVAFQNEFSGMDCFLGGSLGSVEGYYVRTRKCCLRSVVTHWLLQQMEHSVTDGCCTLWWKCFVNLTAMSVSDTDKLTLRDSERPIPIVNRHHNVSNHPSPTDKREAVCAPIQRAHYNTPNAR